MSVIVLKGSADNWFDAAMEHYSDVEAYARRTLRNLDTCAYWTDKVLDYYMMVAESKWQPGKDLRLSMRFLVGSAKRSAVREQERRPLARRVKEEQEQMDTVLDVRDALRKMDEVAKRILTMLSEGFTWHEIERETGWSVWTISKVREELADRLTDYQPTTPTRQRGRGRPRRTS